MIIRGRYQIAIGGALLGSERFQLLGHAIESEMVIERQDPPAVRQHLRITLDTARAPVEVEIAETWGGETTRGRFRIDRAAATLRALVQPEVGASIERLLPFGEHSEIAHVSPLFTFVMLGRLRLRPGERREVPLVELSRTTLMPEPARRRLTRLPDVELRTAGQGLMAADYVLEGPLGETRFQTNLLGLPVRVRLSGGEANVDYVLVE